VHLLAIVSIICVVIGVIKEACTPTLTAEHWANKELEHKDRMSGMSEKEILKNAQKGRYYIPKEVLQAYPIPHREPDGRHRIIIENDELHKADVAQYGAYQAQKWVEQGKYNLNPEELEIVHLQIERKFQHLYSLGCSNKKYAEEYAVKIKEIDAKFATKKWDCRNTEAVRQWQKARAADPRNI
jgi:hypothetical protein